jgi:rhodanese-related sulfurtransferase
VLLDFAQQNVLWLSTALMSGAMLLWPMLRGGSKEALEPAGATSLINREDAVVIDIRDTAEFAAGHIVGARHITLAQLGARMGELDKVKARPIIVCCANGMRSGTAIKQLKSAGFERVFNLTGGIAAWSAASMPLTTKG